MGRCAQRLVLVFIFAACLLLTSGFAAAQQPGKVPQIGYINTPRRQTPPLLSGSPHGYLSEPFLQGLRDLGYMDGQNVKLNIRTGEIAKFHEFAADLVQRKVDIIVTANIDATHAAMQATKTIPIVMFIPSDPVLLGIAASHARPGGNVTGISGVNLDLGGKWLEIVHEVVPSVKRVAVFWSRQEQERFPVWKSVDLVARSLKVDLRWREVVGNYSAFVRGLRSADWRETDGFISLPGFAVWRNEMIAEWGLRNRIPGIFWRTDLAMEQTGGLMAYGVNRQEQSRRAAYIVDKILKGAKPAELPIETPNSFEFVVNLKAAKEIGITIPPRVLAWADRVIK